MRKENTNKTTNGNWAEMLLQPFFMDNSINTLDSLQVDDILEARELAEQLLKMKKLGTLKKEYPLEKVKHRPDGRCYIYIKRKQYIAPTYGQLLEKLYDEFYGTKNYTLSDIFPEWMRYRRDIEKKSSRTLDDHRGYWNNYMKDSKLVKMPIEKIKPRDIREFYESLLKEHEFTKETFEFFKTILNKLFDYTIEHLEVIQYNPVPSIKLDPYLSAFKPTRDTRNDVYKIKDRTKLLNYLESQDEQDIYSLMTQLAFRLIMRIGELKALKWSDIDGDYINICRQTVERREMNDDLTFEKRTLETIDRMKGNTESGKRFQALTPDAKVILEKIKKLNPDSEYIFLQPNGRQINTKTYNTHLKGFCENAGIEYHSSHKIRFTSASLLYDGTNLATLSQLLGHTTTQMTLHYFRNILGKDEVKELMKKLDIVA